MYLHPLGRDWYDLEITTTPAATSVDASFDSGKTWVAGESVTGGFRWMVAGPSHVPEGSPPAYTTVTETMEPLLRFPTNPQRKIERGPLIIISGV